MGLVLVLRHKPICIAVSLWKHACKEVCDVKPGLDPCPLLARLWNRWWLDFVSFIAYKKVKTKFKKAKCVSNRCNDLFKPKKYFAFRCTLKNLGTGIPKTNHFMYQSNWSFNIPPLGATPRAFEFLENFWKISPSRGRKAVQMPHHRSIPGDQMPPPLGNFSVAFIMLRKLCM